MCRAKCFFSHTKCILEQILSCGKVCTCHVQLSQRTGASQCVNVIRSEYLLSDLEGGFELCFRLGVAGDLEVGKTDTFMEVRLGFGLRLKRIFNLFGCIFQSLPQSDIWVR